MWCVNSPVVQGMGKIIPRSIFWLLLRNRWEVGETRCWLCLYTNCLKNSWIVFCFDISFDFQTVKLLSCSSTLQAWCHVISVYKWLFSGCSTLKLERAHEHTRDYNVHASALKLTHAPSTVQPILDFCFFCKIHKWPSPRVSNLKFIR
jgi:hypothetical protein